MIDAFYGMIGIFGFNFAPRGWALCAGQILPIQTNTALFSLLGTYYGGDGRTTFALPDLRGRAPINQDAVNGTVGVQDGMPTVTLLNTNLPAHTHSIAASSASGDSATPQNAYPANTGIFDKGYKTSSPSPALGQMNNSMVEFAGSSQPLSIIQPSLVVNYCIALTGVFPAFD